MSILTSMEHNFQDRNYPLHGSFDGIASTKCLEFFPLTSEMDCSAAKPSLLDLSYIVVEKAPVGSDEMFINNDLQTNDQVHGDEPLLPIQEEASLECGQQPGGLVRTEFSSPPTKLTSSDNAVSQPREEDIGIDIDLGEDQFGRPKSEDEMFGSVKSDGPVTGMLQRQTSLKACGKIIDIVAHHSSPLLNFISREKSFNERAHDPPSNRWRKYKRAALLDSRRIVLLFSILSSVGTLVLIYLTLRIRLAAESLVNA